MSAKYHIIQRKDPRAPEEPGLFYPSIVVAGRVGVREIAQQIAKRSTVSTADVMAVLEGLLELIPEHLEEGRIVDLDFFGTFYLRINCSGERDIEAVSHRNIKQVSTRFVPSKEFKRGLHMIHFEKAKKRASVKKE